MKMPVMLKFSTGRTLACETIDYSEGGVGVALPAKIEVPMHERVSVSLFRGDEEYAFPATVGFTAPGRVGPALLGDDARAGVRVRQDHLRPRRRLDRLGRRARSRTRRCAVCRMC